VIYKGRAIFIELKTKTGTVSKAQRAMHTRLTLSGAPVAVCRSVEGVAAFLEQVVPLRAKV